MSAPPGAKTTSPPDLPAGNDYTSAIRLLSRAANGHRARAEYVRWNLQQPRNADASDLYRAEPERLIRVADELDRARLVLEAQS